LNETTVASIQRAVNYIRENNYFTENLNKMKRVIQYSKDSD